MSLYGKNRKLSKEHKMKISINSSQAKKVIRIKDGKIYNSIKLCAEDNNITRHTLEYNRIYLI